MRCPICGAKMVQGQLCKYCGVTDEQVNNASNKKVSQYRKNDMSDLVYFTTDVPSDVNKIALLMYTIFLGFIGVNHYYVKRNIRGTFSLISTVIAIILLILKLSIPTLNSVLVFRIFYEITFTCFAINILLWICDILNVIFRRFKVPVVLAEKGDKKWQKSL